ncbi:MAG TPA: aminotransferase class I/II-fold pyridoxal phosphate-dependent enzyme [Clostridia bacterium]|nr:aminotransferase class I/II-fold pyridoxal phosphate-dependent enzyme [Clostridia bacterium]
MTTNNFNAPLYKMLKNYADEKNRFHMPAHSGVQIDKLKNSSWKFSTLENDNSQSNSMANSNPKNGSSSNDNSPNNSLANNLRTFNDEYSLYASAPFDITELSFSDNLNCPNGVIACAENLMADAYGVKKSLFFTAGATSAIFTALGAIRTRTDSIAIDLLSHKSVFSACHFFGFEITLIRREFDDADLPLPLCADKILETLSRDSKIGAVVITSPDYFGNALEVEEIAKVTRSKNSLLLVDEAHGSHFAFSSLLPPSACRYADLTVDSLHKTMPVFTGGAVLNINCDLSTQCALYRANLHTSSPSYVTMGSLDYARELYQNEGEKIYAELKKAIDTLMLENLKYSYKNAESPMHDFSRLVINVDAEKLEKKNIYPEMKWGEWCVFICTPFNMNRLPALSKALSELVPTTVIDDNNSKLKITTIDDQSKLLIVDFDNNSEYRNIDFVDKTNLQPNDSNRNSKCISNENNSLNTLEFPSTLSPLCKNSKTEFVELKNSLNRVSAIEVGCYPPGSPILFAGERITAEKLNFLMRRENSIFNLVTGKICVIIENVID